MYSTVDESIALTDLLAIMVFTVKIFNTTLARGAPLRGAHNILQGFLDDDDDDDDDNIPLVALGGRN